MMIQGFENIIKSSPDFPGTMDNHLSATVKHRQQVYQEWIAAYSPPKNRRERALLKLYQGLLKEASRD